MPVLRDVGIGSAVPERLLGAHPAACNAACIALCGGRGSGSRAAVRPPARLPDLVRRAVPRSVGAHRRVLAARPGGDWPGRQHGRCSASRRSASSARGACRRRYRGAEGNGIGGAARAGDSDPDIRACFIGRFTRQARLDDMAAFVTPAAIRAPWPLIERSVLGDLRRSGRRRSGWQVSQRHDAASTGGVPRTVTTRRVWVASLAPLWRAWRPMVSPAVLCGGRRTPNGCRPQKATRSSS
jgi:hypothetical protein